PGPDRPGQPRAGAPAGPARDPAGGVDHLPPPTPPGASQRGGLRRRAGHPRRTRQHRHYHCPAVPASGPAAVRDPRRRLESCWANNRPAYRCRHGYTSAITPDPARPKNTYVRKDYILPRLPALHARLSAAIPPAARRRRRTRAGVEVARPVSAQDMIDYLRAGEITLTYDPRAATLRADTPDAVTTVIGRAS